MIKNVKKEVLKYMLEIKEISNLNKDLLEIPAPGIHLYKNIFEPKWFIDELEKECASDWSSTQWRYASTDGGTNSDYRSSMNCSLHEIFDPSGQHRLYKSFKEKIYDPIFECVADYMRSFDIRGGVHEILEVLKYSNGAQYRAHWDHGKNAPRIFSLVAFLSTPENGGDLEFPHFNVTVPSVEGNVVIFPANHPYLHVAHPVYSGVKYAMVTWF